MLGFLLQRNQNESQLAKSSISRNSNRSTSKRIIEPQSEVQGIKIFDSAIAHPIYEKPNSDFSTKSHMDFYV